MHDAPRTIRPGRWARRPGVAGLLAAAWLAAGPAAQAQTSGAPAFNFEAQTVAQLATLCGATPSVADFERPLAFCYGFLHGVGQYHSAITQPGSGNRPVFCPPTPVPTRAEAARAFVTWANAHPEFAQERAVDGLARWAQASYPCPAQAAAPRRAAR